MKAFIEARIEDLSEGWEGRDGLVTTSRPGSEQGVARLRRPWWYAASLAVVTALAFVPVVGNGFVKWDDDRNFLDNPAFSGLSLENLRWAWSTGWLGVYQPLAWMLMEAEFDAWGLNPRAYHAVSLIGHVANAVVLWVLTRRFWNGWAGRGGAVGNRSGEAGIVGTRGALYAVHPLRVEVVAWASCQPYLPSVLFAMLATLAYLSACDDHRPAGRFGWLAGAWVLYAMGSLMKVVPVMLPAVLLVLDVYPLRRLGPGGWTGRGAWRVYGEKLPFLAVALPLMVVAFRVRGDDDLRAMNEAPIDRLARACVSPGFYLLKTAFPLDLVAFYPTPGNRLGYVSGMSAAAIVTTAGVTLAVFVVRRRWPGRRRPGCVISWPGAQPWSRPNGQVVPGGPILLLPLDGRRGRVGPRPGPAGQSSEGLAAIPSGRGGAGRRPLAFSWRQCFDWKSSERSGPGQSNTLRRTRISTWCSASRRTRRESSPRRSGISSGP